MRSVQEIVELNNIATDYVVGTQGPVDTSAAELVLRNTAVAADRLRPYQFRTIGESAVEALKVAAKAAQEVSPMPREDCQRLPGETDLEYQLRVEIAQPLHRLQAAVSSGEFDKKDSDTVSAVKAAVWLGSVAFEEVLTDPATDDFMEMQHTMRYFTGNVNAAAGRAEMQKQMMEEASQATPAHSDQ